MIDSPNKVINFHICEIHLSAVAKLVIVQLKICQKNSFKTLEHSTENSKQIQNQRRMSCSVRFQVKPNETYGCNNNF